MDAIIGDENNIVGRSAAKARSLDGDGAPYQTNHHTLMLTVRIRTFISEKDHVEPGKSRTAKPLLSWSSTRSTLISASVMAKIGALVALFSFCHDCMPRQCMLVRK
jgi:hypothetical protein